MVILNMKHSHMLFVLQRQAFKREFSPRIPMYMRVTMQTLVSKA